MRATKSFDGSPPAADLESAHACGAKKWPVLDIKWRGVAMPPRAATRRIRFYDGKEDGSRCQIGFGRPSYCMLGSEANAADNCQRSEAFSRESGRQCSVPRED